jgi:hypothetical protein
MRRRSSKDFVLERLGIPPHLLPWNPEGRIVRG